MTNGEAAMRLRDAAAAGARIASAANSLAADAAHAQTIEGADLRELAKDAQLVLETVGRIEPGDGPFHLYMGDDEPSAWQDPASWDHELTRAQLVERITGAAAGIDPGEGDVWIARVQATR